MVSRTAWRDLHTGEQSLCTLKSKHNMGVGRVLDFVFFVYFLTHIPITIFIDLQAFLPSSWFPAQAVELKDWYAREFKDAMMADDPPAWFKSFVFCELTMQFPFFFVATYAFYKGGCRWIRIPAIIYGTHVATTLVPILCHVMTHDFRSSPHPGPSTPEERLVLTGIYMPYLVIPVLLVLRMVLSGDYAPLTKSKSY